MKLHAYGDSWTEGQGTVENRKEWKKYSWVKLLSDRFKIKSSNNGVSGRSNLKIFNKIVSDIRNSKISNNDLVIVMWSSSLRDSVPFLPKNEWVSWSVKHLIELPHKFIESYKSDNEKYDIFLSSFKEHFLLNLFNQNYYNIVNQNYIVFTQKLFEFYGIKYIMCDAFENMVLDLSEEDDKTVSIDKNYYWGFGNRTIRDLLNDTNRDDIWEHVDNFKTRPTQHPNIEGYKLIAEELYNFITNTIQDTHR